MKTNHYIDVKFSIRDEESLNVYKWTKSLFRYAELD